MRIIRLKKIIEIDGERLEPFHIRELGRNEIIEDENGIKGPEIPHEKLKIKVVFKDQRLKSFKKKKY